MIEKEVQKKIATSAEVLGLWYYKLPDAPASMGFDSKIRFTPNKPCDCIIASGGKTAFLELKATKERRLPFSCVRKESQERYLSGLVAAGIPAWLLVYWNPGGYLYAFPWAWWTLQRECSTQKSIVLGLDELDGYRIAETTVGQRRANDGHLWGGRWAWDLRPLLGIVRPAVQAELEEAA